MENKTMTEPEGLKFNCMECKRPQVGIPWPHEYENLEGHYYALCQRCKMEHLRAKFAYIKDVALVKELIKHHIQELRAKLVLKRIENLEAEGGLVFIGDALGTSPTAESPEPEPNRPLTKD